MAQYISLILVTAQFMMTRSLAQQPPHPVTLIPTHYVTGAYESPKPLEMFVYQAKLCNDVIYKGMTVLTSVNIPSGWTPNIGLVAKLQVCTTANCSNVLCTNYPEGKFNGQHNCTFLYNTTITSLFVSVTAGDAPYISWTVAVEFLFQSQYRKEPMKNSMFYQMLGFPEPIAINEVTDADVKLLEQIVPPGNTFSVTTMNRMNYKMAFCPDAGETSRYNIDIVVTALDSVSAMATYVCLPPIDPDTGCTPENANISDPRGIAINSVEVSTESGFLNDVYIAVVGWGDGEQTNHFLIRATMTKM